MSIKETNQLSSLIVNNAGLSIISRYLPTAKEFIPIPIYLDLIHNDEISFNAIWNILPNFSSLSGVHVNLNQYQSIISIINSLEFFNRLFSINSLTLLSLYGSFCITPLANALIHNKTLTTLELWDNNIRGEGTRALAAALENNHTLTVFDVSYNNITDEGIRALAASLKNNHTLTILNANSNDTGTVEISHLIQILSLLPRI